MTGASDGSCQPRVPQPVKPLTRNQLVAARRLLHRRGRASAGAFLVEGAQAVREALRAHSSGRAVVCHLVVTDPARHADLLGMAGELPVLLADARQAGQLGDTVTAPGIWAVTRCLIPAAFEPGHRSGLAVICAQVRDPGNAGTVIRCADAFGADAVLLTRGSVELTNPKTVRASVGSIFHLPVYTDMAFAQTIEWARGRGMQLLAADATGIGLDALTAAGRLTRPTCWIFGNEAWGLPADARAAADEVVAIPMWGQAESLNLSAAAAVCLYASASFRHRVTDR